MSKTPLKIEELRELIHKGEAADPLIFLESVMNGGFTNGELSPEDWNEIMDYTINHAKYKPVALSESHSAAKTLAEYLHPKRKQIEKIDPSLAGDGSHVPLTEEEIELFKEKFNDEF
jgi:hypothetical protein